MISHTQAPSGSTIRITSGSVDREPHSGKSSSTEPEGIAPKRQIASVPGKFSRQSHFLTGATGLLGSYILRGLLLDGKEVAVLARSSRRQSAQERIFAMVADWEHEFQRSLPRPLVISGSLADPTWGIQHADWFSKCCRSVIHCAASLQFRGAPGCDPWVSNIEGTRRILEICERSAIRELHYVSTAYVAGTQENFTEHHVDIGQELRNDYEKSKLAAEKMVRNAGFLDSLTIYRPSIVVGDSQTGWTTTYHGFYAALRLAHTLASQMPRGENRGQMVLDLLQTTGRLEHKNFVPVDWVCNVFSHIHRTPELHGQTYHLTSPEPILLLDFMGAIQDAVDTWSQFAPDGSNGSDEWFRRTYIDQMDVYLSYVQNDPAFDVSNTRAAAPHLPCPKVDRELLLFLAREAILSDFGKNNQRSQQNTTVSEAGV